MEQLQNLVGKENGLARVAAAVRQLAESLHAPVVGAYQLTCSDETEWECAAAFQQGFAGPLLPPLKGDHRAAFRTANLGAQYERGAVGIAEEHFAAEPSHGAFKLMVVKINSHVAVRPAPAGPEYGRLERYGRESACCGALAALLKGGRLPAVERLKETFESGGEDRLSVLRNPREVPPAERALRAAIVNARLQADLVLADLRQSRPETPTVFLVLPCVTLNRPDADSELIVGHYGIDWTELAPKVKYQGLGTDPAAYRINYEQGRLHVEEGPRGDW